MTIANGQIRKGLQEPAGAWIRGDVREKKIYLCFTAHDFIEGLPFVIESLRNEKINASFFLTGDFVRNNPELALVLYQDGHYVGAHSDRHLLYCDWGKRDSLLVSISEIKKDLDDNVNALATIGIPRRKTRVFMPPYEWYNREIAQHIQSWGYDLVNFTPGTSSNADYTTPDMKNYLGSDTILSRIYNHERKDPHHLNGFYLLLHVGTDPKRKDKFYRRLPELIQHLKQLGYDFARF